MATPAQISANRRNAARSTGPHTLKGKAVASRNALRHGLLAKDVVLRDEDQQLFDERRETMRAHLDPVGELEELLVERIVLCAWRLRRSGHIEASLFQHEIFNEDIRRATDLAEEYTESPFAGLGEREVTDERQHAAALRQVEKAEADRDRETLAIAFTNATKGTEPLVKLSRYEVAIERSLYRALHELQRLQAARQGRDVAAPAVVDVEVSGSAG